MDVFSWIVLLVACILAVSLIITWVVQARTNKATDILRKFSTSVDLPTCIDEYEYALKITRQSDATMTKPLDSYATSRTVKAAMLLIANRLGELGYTYGITYKTVRRYYDEYVFQLYYDDTARIEASDSQLRNMRSVFLTLKEFGTAVSLCNKPTYYCENAEQDENTFEVTIPLHEFNMTFDELVTSFKIHGPDALIKS